MIWSALPADEVPPLLLPLQRPHGVVQLRTSACPSTFRDNPKTGVRVLVPEQPSGTASLQLPRQGIVRNPPPPPPPPSLHA